MGDKHVRRQDRATENGTPRRRPVHRHAMVIAAVAFLSSACSGPQIPLSVGAREVPSEIVLTTPKDAEEQAAAPVPPIDLLAVTPTGGPLSGELPPVGGGVLPPLGEEDDPSRPPVTDPNRPPCPAADPDAVPPRPALTSVSTLPWPDELYEFRNVGVEETSGANAATVPLPKTGTRIVERLRRTTISVSTGVTGSDRKDLETLQFDVTATLGDTTTRTTYMLLRESSFRDVPRTEGGPTPGLYIDSVTTERAGDSRVFDPEPNLQLLRFPIARGDTWDTAGADATTGEAMAFTATVGGGTVDINACGTWLDAWPVKIDGSFGPKSTPAGPPPENPLGGAAGVDPTTGRHVFFNAEYSFATGYGPLMVKEAVEVVTTAATGRTVRRATSTINREPRGACSVVVSGEFASCQGEA